MWTQDFENAHLYLAPSGQEKGPAEYKETVVPLAERTKYGDGGGVRLFNRCGWYPAAGSRLIEWQN